LGYGVTFIATLRQVGDKVKEGGEVVHEAMVEVAEAIKEALNKAADGEDGANAQAPAEMSPEEKKKRMCIAPALRSRHCCKCAESASVFVFEDDGL
jgi:hypothetical protein